MDDVETCGVEGWVGPAVGDPAQEEQWECERRRRDGKARREEQGGGEEGDPRHPRSGGDTAGTDQAVSEPATPQHTRQRAGRDQEEDRGRFDLVQAEPGSQQLDPERLQAAEEEVAEGRGDNQDHVRRNAQDVAGGRPERHAAWVVPQDQLRAWPHVCSPDLSDQLRRDGGLAGCAPVGRVARVARDARWRHVPRAGRSAPRPVPLRGGLHGRAEGPPGAGFGWLGFGWPEFGWPEFGEEPALPTPERLREPPRQRERQRRPRRAQREERDAPRQKPGEVTRDEDPDPCANQLARHEIPVDLGSLAGEEEVAGERGNRRAGDGDHRAERKPSREQHPVAGGETRGRLGNRPERHRRDQQAHPRDTVHEHAEGERGQRCDGRRDRHQQAEADRTDTERVLEWEGDGTHRGPVRAREREDAGEERDNAESGQTAHSLREPSLEVPAEPRREMERLVGLHPRSGVGFAGSNSPPGPPSAAREVHSRRRYSCPARVGPPEAKSRRGAGAASSFADRLRVGACGGVGGGTGERHRAGGARGLA